MPGFRKFLSILGLGALIACCASSARADNIHLCDINAFTTCNAGTVIPTHSTTAYVFGTSNTSDTLHVAILAPQSGTAAGSNIFSSGTNLWTVLGEAPAQVFPTFASTLSQETGATGMVPGSFLVSDADFGNWTGSVNAGQLITLPNEPVGTIFIAFLENSSGQLQAVCPWSSSLINVATPEPSSLLLLGTGLLACLGLAWRRP